MTRDSAGRFRKGASGNPTGVAKAKAAPGSDGVVSYGGYVASGEQNAKLTGSRKWVEYANARAFPPVAIAMLLRNALLSGANWSLTENEAGGKDARRGAEVVQQGLLDARLPKPWQEVVAQAGMAWLEGSSLHATAMGRRKDGMVVFTDIAHRPMHTIQKWFRGPDGYWASVEQRTADGKTTTIDLDECLYVVDGAPSDDPFGAGVLRLAIERLRRAGEYEGLEGHEMFNSMGGMPIARVPLEEINKFLEQFPETERAGKKTQLLSAIETVIDERVKHPNKRMYAILDSATFQGTDPAIISAIRKWDIEIVKGDLQGLADIRKTITDHHLDVARIVGVEFVYVGGGDSAGTYGMHESKVGVFASTLQTGLTRIARRSQPLVRRLVAANGLDPDTAAPTLVPEKITIASVLEVVQALEGMERAALRADDPARKIIRERIGLPDEPEARMLDLGLPRPPAPPKEPDPNEEEAEPVDPAEGAEPKAKRRRVR